MAYQKSFMQRKMDIFCGFFWVFLSNILQIMFGIFSRIFMRYYSAEAIDSALPPTSSQEKSKFSEPKTEDETGCGKCFAGNQIESNCEQQEAESKNDCSETLKEDENFGIEEEESVKLVFKFQYQTWKYSEELNGSNGESYDFVNSDMVISSTSKYEFVPGTSFSNFLEKPEVPNFTVKEVYINSSDEPFKNKGVNDSGFLAKRDSKGTNFPENSKEKVENISSAEQPCSQIVGMENSTDRIMGSASAADNFLVMSSGSESDMGAENLDVGYEAEDFDEEENENVIEHLGNIEESQMQNSDKFSKPNRGKEPGDYADESTALDFSEESNHLETLWEHQDLIEQLKMELKKVRATGLPTILEDSESPRIMEDLKPWKIEEKFHHENGISELPKFYRSYRERMRKFDILNYQKMYAIGYLQSKDPLQSYSSRKSSASSITSLLSESFGLCGRRKPESDPVKKLLRELYCDLETVYVGQLCLSWEFLRWEYEKALELWASHAHQHGSSPRYNEVAGEFQQFQVLLQRFMENASFQGPRVENYVKNRCAMKNLLQVPIIREDSAKEKRKWRKRETDGNATTSEMLVEIVEESIKTIWCFIRTDKDSSSSMTLKGVRETQHPSDSQQIRADLQKKEKRLREVLRSRKCVLNKLKKHKEDEQPLCFLSQVDVKLVCRVLNMSKINSDQLAWCRNKLNKINFVNQRIHVESSFLLFPY